MIKKVEIIGFLVLLVLLSGSLAPFSLKKPEGILKDTLSPIALVFVHNHYFKLSLLVDSFIKNSISHNYARRKIQKIVKEISHANNYTQSSLKRVAQFSDYGNQTEKNMALLEKIDHKAQQVLENIMRKQQPDTMQLKMLTAFEEEV